MAHPPIGRGWEEIDPTGNVTRSLGCEGGLQARFHDMIAEPEGSYWLMCDEVRTMGLSASGGVAAARVTGTQVQHRSAAGDLLFRWSPFDHFAITDVDSTARAGPNVNWTHGNALTLDHDGNLLVSFRTLSEITKIDSRTGDVMWRMGGLRNQFTFQGTATPAFARQHGVRAASAGRILLLDNLGESSGSRAEVYEVSTGAARVARLVASLASSPGVVAQVGGTTQPLPNGRALIAFGDGGRVEEYDSLGNVVWRIDGNPGYVFRAQRIRSLYQPGVDIAR